MRRVIGFWIRGLMDDDYPPPHELVRAANPPLESLVGNYLDLGKICCAYRGIEMCEFRHDRELGNTDLTDGDWVWPCGLSHYVREHHVVLPDEFVANVVANGGRPSRTDLVDDPEGTGHGDDSYWIDWCRSHADGSLRDRILQARSQADEEAGLHLELLARELEGELGISTVKCQWAGCERPALKERAICGRCTYSSPGVVRTTATSTIYSSHLSSILESWN